MTIHWQWSHFDKLTLEELYDILALRQQVFIEEQHCIYNDLDYIDQKCAHLLGKENGKLAAYLRVLPPNTPYPDAISFGRVLTASSARGKGIGKDMIQRTLSYFKEQQVTLPIIISAQAYLQKFYESFGFECVGEPYDEAGIVHIKMKRPPMHV